MYTSMLADVTSVLADITSDCSVQVYATDGLLMATPPPLSIAARAPSPSQIHGTSFFFFTHNRRNTEDQHTRTPKLTTRT